MPKRIPAYCVVGYPKNELPIDDYDLNYYQVCTTKEITKREMKQAEYIYPDYDWRIEYYSILAE